MEDFSKPASPYRGRRRGNYVPRTIFNPAADVLAGIEYVEGTFKERRDKVNLFQQQAEQRRIDMQKLVNDTQRIDQTETMTKMTEQFSNMVTDIYKADIASFDGDRSDYLNKANNAQRVIGSFGKVIGTVNELSNEFLSKNPAEQKKMVLRNQFLGKDGDKRKAYMDFLNDPSKMNIRIQGEDIIITNNGQDLFNGTQLLNSVKDGNGLIEYANDYTEQIGAASKDAMSGIKNLVVAKQYEGMSDDGSRVYTTAKNDYLGAVDQYRKNLENSDKIDALLNESTFQRYIDGDENYNSQKHDAATKAAIIDQLIIKEFPMYKEKLDEEGKIESRSAIGDKKQTTKEIQGPSALDLRKMSLKEREQKLKEIKLQKELEEELAPKFKNQVGEKYGSEQTDNFLTARKKYSDIKISIDQMRDYFNKDKRTYNKDKIIDSETKKHVLEPFYPGINDVPFEEINTPLKLKNTLSKLFLPATKDEKGVDYDTFIVMNKDYENFLKEQEQVSSPEVKIKTQAEFDKAYASLAPGKSMIVNGTTYTKPNK